MYFGVSDSRNTLVEYEYQVLHAPNGPSPHHLLLLAILESSIEHLFRVFDIFERKKEAIQYAAKKPRNYYAPVTVARKNLEGEYAWFFYTPNDEDESPFTFKNICEELGIDSGAMRTGLLAKLRNPMRQKHFRKHGLHRVIHHPRIRIRVRRRRSKQYSKRSS